jgi:hypothetical protein
MSAWNRINEQGGTIILRVACAGFALGCVYGAGVVAWRAVDGTGLLDHLGGLMTLVSGVVLFGGYALFANRLVVRKFDWKGDAELGLEPRSDVDRSRIRR